MACDMLLELAGKNYPVLLQFREAVQYSVSKQPQQEQPVDRSFTAQRYGMEHNTFMLLFQGALGVYVTTGLEVAGLGVAPGVHCAWGCLLPAVSGAVMLPADLASAVVLLW